MVGGGGGRAEHNCSSVYVCISFLALALANVSGPYKRSTIGKMADTAAELRQECRLSKSFVEHISRSAAAKVKDP